MFPETQNAEETSATAKRPLLNDAVEGIVECAERAESSTGFLKECLGLIAEALHAPFGVLEVRLRSHVVEDVYSNPPSQRDFWEKTAQSVLTDAMSDRGPRARLFRGRQMDGGVALFSAPIRAAGGTCSGAVVIIASYQEKDLVHEQLTALEALSSIVARLLTTLGQERRTARAEIADDQLGSLRKVSGFSTPTELAYTLTNKLRTRDGLDLVALGTVRGKRARILSISGLDEVSRKSPGVRLLHGAMEECLDLGCPVVVQPGGRLADDVASAGRLHARWSEAGGNAAVASIPLRRDEKIVAVLSVRQPAGGGFDAETLGEYRDLVEAYTATLGMVERAGRSLLAHAWIALRRGMREIFTNRGWGTKLKLMLPIATALWLVFGTLVYELKVPCTIEPADARQLGAPGDGLLASIYAMPGDPVAEGDVLCEFDTAELRLDKLKLESEIAIREIEEARALAAGEPLQLQLARANRRELEASVALVDHRIEAAQVRAPLDGVVVSGDLRERIGDVFAKGEPLFEVATTEGWSLELEIPESDVPEVEPGMSGRFSSLARPEEGHDFQLQAIEPSARTQGGNNVFVAEADAELEDAWMRAGMQGLAKIEIGERVAWWVLFHRAEDWFRLHLWL